MDWKTHEIKGSVFCGKCSHVGKKPGTRGEEKGLRGEKKGRGGKGKPPRKRIRIGSL